MDCPYYTVLAVKLHRLFYPGSSGLAWPLSYRRLQWKNLRPSILLPDHM